MDLLVKNAALRNTRGKEKMDIGIENGMIKEISPSITIQAKRQIDADGKMVSPPFVDPHLHLDATMTAGDPNFNQSGTLLEGIQIWAEKKKDITVEDIKQRAKQAIKWELAHGTQHIRTHADASNPDMTSVKALTQLRDELKDVVDIQVVAFPQDGIFAHENGERLLKEALDRGADVVGGIPHNELTREDGVKDVELVFELAKEYNKIIDVHCDETDDEHSRFIEVMAALTIKYGFHGQVTASHTTAMHSYNNAYASKLMGILKRADFNIITNPFCNIILQARGDSYPKRRGITRVDELLENDVNVGIGHDCILDPWYPLGKGSMLEAASMLLHVSQLTGYQEIYQVFDLITDNSAKILNIQDHYGIKEGNPANMIILNAANEYEAIRKNAACLYSIRHGNIIVEGQPSISRIKAEPLKAEPVDFNFSRV